MWLSSFYLARTAEALPKGHFMSGKRQVMFGPIVRREKKCHSLDRTKRKERKP